MADKLVSPTTLFASAARTATATSSVFRRTGQARGFAIQVDCTASADTPSVVFTLQNRTTTNGGTWATVLASAAVTGAATVNLIAHPDAADTANLSENTQTLDVWRVIATHADSDSITYSVKVWPLA